MEQTLMGIDNPFTQCTKLPYASERAAREAIRNAKDKRRKGNPHRREARAYQCPQCNSWHLTSIRLGHSY
jgi:hypothetical protein